VGIRGKVDFGDVDCYGDDYYGVFESKSGNDDDDDVFDKVSSDGDEGGRYVFCVCRPQGVSTFYFSNVRETFRGSIDVGHAAS
jgi:hypothetical protein